MIKVKTAENTLTNIAEVYAKTSAGVLAPIAEVYQVVEQDGKKVLEKVYSSAPPALTPPTITDVYSEGSTVYVKYEPNANGDAVEFRFDEYAANGTQTHVGTWRDSEVFGAYGCTEYVHVYARSVRDGENSDETFYEYYLGMSDHSLHYTSNNDGVHYIRCDVCGEDLGEGYCMDHDKNGDGVCDLCGGEAPI